MNDFFKKKEVIYKIYEEQSFSKAAQKLYTSQPALSTIVHHLEQEIGGELFDRSCKPIRLTELGRAYIQATKDMQSIERNFYNYACEIGNLEIGSIAVGCNQLLSSTVMPQYATRFLSQYPKIQLSLTDANTIELEKRLNAGELDLVLDNHAMDPDRFDASVLWTERLLLAVPAAFSANREARNYRLSCKDILEGRHVPEQKTVPLSLFEAHPFILMNRDNDTRHRTDRYFRDADFSPRIALELDRMVNAYRYVTLGGAIAVVSDTLVKNSALDGSSVWFYRLPDAYACRDVCIYCRKNQHRSPAMNAFYALLNENR